MQAVLLTLGTLGFCAVVFSVYMVIVANRRYMPQRVEHPHVQYRTRSGMDRRRSTSDVVFPLKLPGGETVMVDRRRGERRRALA